jgi:ribosomal protein S18 acetylase RimI-like enzyme
VDDATLLERNLRGLATLHRLLGRYAGTVVELDSAVGSLADTAPDDPWLNSLVCEPGASFGAVLERVLGTPELARLGVWAWGPDQVAMARDAGFSDLIARVPAMGMELTSATSSGGDSGPILPAEAGALSDTVYGNDERELERTLGLIPADQAPALGRRDSRGRLLAAVVLLVSEDDCSVQYVATLPDAQRLGHATALLGDALAQARRQGASTTTLQASEEGERLYRRLGYRTVGQLELRHRARRLPGAGPG